MYVYYDYKYAPNTFDFAVFLANAYIYTKANGVRITHIFLVADQYKNDISWECQPTLAYHDNKAANVAFVLSTLCVDRPSISLITDRNLMPVPTDRSFPPDYKKMVHGADGGGG
jgi:hypothetical protein